LPLGRYVFLIILMISNNQKNTPSGLYVLSGVMLLTIIIILYYAITVPPYRYLAVILIPLFIYMGVGIIRRWPRARPLVMVVAMLSFVGAVANILSPLFMKESQNLTSTGAEVINVIQLVILSVVFFYLRSEKVKSYFNSAT